MILNFRSKALKRLFETDDARAIAANLLPRTVFILVVLDVAKTPQALQLPGFGLHPLKGKLKGFWAVSVNANWRIIFRMQDGHVIDVDLLDYH